MRWYKKSHFTDENDNGNSQDEDLEQVHAHQFNAKRAVGDSGTSSALADIKKLFLDMEETIISKLSDQLPAYRAMTA